MKQKQMSQHNMNTPVIPSVTSTFACEDITGSMTTAIIRAMNIIKELKGLVYCEKLFNKLEQFKTLLLPHHHLLSQMSTHV
jgi:hypothetical protein